MSAKVKQILSLVPVTITLGFLYWLKEDKNMRGLKDTNILDLHSKLSELVEEYEKKYPEGLTGWS